MVWDEASAEVQGHKDLPALHEALLKDNVNYTDRYEALGIPRPDPASVCGGLCEGTGYVPLQKSGAEEEPWKTLWEAAEALQPSGNGWHFVTCPECKGAGVC